MNAQDHASSTRVDEITDGIFRISTPVHQASFQVALPSINT